MKDYVVFVCAKNTLSVLRTDFFNAVYLHSLVKYFDYKPETEDIYVYEVVIPKMAAFKTGIF